MAGVGFRERDVEVWGGRLAMRFKTAGTGPPLVYLHPAAGLHFDPFLEDRMSFCGRLVMGRSALHWRLSTRVAR